MGTHRGGKAAQNRANMLQLFVHLVQRKVQKEAQPRRQKFSGSVEMQFKRLTYV
jgi:hypothetical protein